MKVRCFQCKKEREDSPQCSCGCGIVSCPYCNNINCQLRVQNDGSMVWQCLLRQR